MFAISIAEVCDGKHLTCPMLYLRRRFHSCNSVQVIHAFLFIIQNSRVSVGTIPAVEQASGDVTDFVVNLYVFRTNGAWFLVQQVPGSR
jgi:hypothetical protein